MKTIFHIITELDVGGTELQLALLLPSLDKETRHEVVCLQGHGHVGTKLELSGIPVHYLEGKGNRDISIPINLYKLLRKHRPDIVVTYLFYADIIGRIAARLAGIRAVIESHRSHLFGPSWYHQLDRYTRWLVTHYVCQSQATKLLIHRVLHVPLSSITIIPNAVSRTTNEKESVIRKLYQIATEDPIITCVANLKPEKNIHILLEAFEDVFLHAPTLHLLLIGEGNERKRLERQILSYTSKDHIHFVGLRRDIQNILDESDIFVLPTQIEGMSNAVLEALAAGLPCITTDIPANRELIEQHKNGILIPVGNSSQLADAIHFLLENPHIRISLGNEAKRRIQNYYTIPIIASKWDALFRSL